MKRVRRKAAQAQGGSSRDLVAGLVLIALGILAWGCAHLMWIYYAGAR